MGRTTGFTVGNIVDISWDGFIDYSDEFNDGRKHEAWFENQLRIDGGKRPFCLNGDSGSLVLSLSDLRPVGLLFAGDNKRFAFCNHISTVMRKLHIPSI